MHTKEKAPASGANSRTTSEQFTKERALSQCARILEHLKHYGRLTTLDARGMGIMHPGMRVCELRKRGVKIETAWAYQADETGSVHRLGVYIWLGRDAGQSDLFQAEA